jgi:hypothetical protein
LIRLSLFFFLKQRRRHLTPCRVQAILTDPYINNLLKDMQTNPQSAQRAMSDARVAGQIEKLMIAGACCCGV